MHWIGDAAVRAGLAGTTSLLIPNVTPAPEAWEIAARTLGLTPTELAQRIAPAVRLNAANLGKAQPQACRLVPEKLARRFNVFPIRDDDRHLVLATADPANLECEQAVAFAAGRRVTFELAPPHAIAQAIDRAYDTDRTLSTMLAQVDEHVLDAVRVLDEAKPESVAARDVEAAPVVQLTNLILRDGIMGRASDIHIEPADGMGSVRFRVDGVMRRHMSLPMPALNRVVSRIKVLSKLDIADRIRPQDGRARLQVENTTYDLRVSTVPIRDAEKAVIRILRPDNAARLNDVGLAPPELARLRQLLAQRDGIVLVTGPTGSGKTTTLYAVLREIADGAVNITTVEDPVEYELPGVAQIQVDPKRGVTFASALRAVLRQDPDVIFVGEIRDLETAEIAVQAAMTGHLVLATLHTNDAVSAVGRLVDLGLDRPAIASSLRGSLAQRLMRRLCGECAQPVGEQLTPEESRLSAQFGVRPVLRATGCARCNNTGYFGRVPIDEVAVFTPAMLEQVGQGASMQALQRAATASGMRTLRETAAERVRAGESTLSEMERVVGETGAGAGVSVVDGPAAAEPQPAAAPAILVVDDDPVQRLLVSATLQKCGYTVAQSADGADALRRIAGGEECALVITDLHMTEVDGDEVVRRLRADARTAALPVVVLTGSAESQRESELIEMGADDYIRKPVDPQLLVARVRAALRRAGG